MVEAVTVVNAHGTCRLPYNLLKDNKEQEKGYLLSSKDVCSLDILPKLLSIGVKSFKIEGRMKSPEYVGIVTSIYRKYIDLAESNKEYIVDKKDKEILMQIFNRGGFSTGYLNGKLGKEMMYTKKPNHMGILIGNVISYNKNKGYVKIKLNKKLNLGDSISIQDSTCKISELMIENTNIKSANEGQVVTIGRIHGNIKEGLKIYKTVDINLNKEFEQKNCREKIKRKINCKIKLIESQNLEIELEDILGNTKINYISKIVVGKAEKGGLTKQRIEEQISKTGNTVFEIKNIEIIMDNNIIVPISAINEIRRSGLEQLENKLVQSFKRDYTRDNTKLLEYNTNISSNKIKVNLCLNNISENIDYTKLKNIDNIYIPFRFFLNDKFKKIINSICLNFNTYILLPSVAKGNYEKLIKQKISEIANIKGVIVSNISQIEYVKNKNIELIANYTLNIANNYTVQELKKMRFTKFIVSPEFNKQTIQNFENIIDKEVIVYGRTLLMTSEYCVIGPYFNCKGLCEKGKYELKDRMNFKFPVYTDRLNCNNLIYNSKITSICWKDLNVNSIRIDILEETEQEIQDIINTHIKNERLEGEIYTNGNLNKDI